MAVGRPPAVDGTEQVRSAVADLSASLPAPLAPLAELAYNYRWSWTGGDALFAAIDEARFARLRRNPVALLRTTPRAALERAAADRTLVERAAEAVTELRGDLGRATAELPALRGPVAFICAEYGVHASLPIYSGGLGALAGDILKESSDMAVPLIAVGLLYREGYFNQRLDHSGFQREHWTPVDPGLLPVTSVRDAADRRLLISVPLRGTEIAVNVWRVDVGRVPLYLLDTDVDANSPADRWITSRLYVGDRRTRLDQYAVLGIGAVRALHAMGIEPGVIHMNEGHAGLAPLELAARLVKEGTSVDEALAQARQLTVFTTHTPVAAGNEVIAEADLQALVPHLAPALGIDDQRLLGIGQDGRGGGFGLSPLGIRMSRHANAVSRRHGEVAREMWLPMFPGLEADAVPIDHVTNGVHTATWMAPEMRALIDRHLEPGWRDRSDDPQTWTPVESIPDGELWAVRTALRRRLVREVRRRAVMERLRRGETREYAEAVGTTFDDEVLTVGFARRIATYKRLHLLVRDALRGAALLRGARRMQVVIAGKAHPSDDEAKRIMQNLFELKRVLGISGGIVVLEDYDLELGSLLVSGCDVWVNLPRPPMEASGTSGMKAALNGCLNLSVLDGWWCEGYDGRNGWAIEGAAGAEVVDGAEAADAADAEELLRILEQEALPEFWARENDGPPHAWLDRVRHSIATLGPFVDARRMVRTYAGRIWTG